MSRPAKPYLHRGWWVTNVGGKRHKLCHEDEGRTTAHDAFYRLCGQRVENTGRTFPDLRVGQLIALFLDTVKVEKSESTYRNYQRWLDEFDRLHGQLLATQ